MLLSIGQVSAYTIITTELLRSSKAYFKVYAFHDFSSYLSEQLHGNMKTKLPFYNTMARDRNKVLNSFTKLWNRK